MKLSFLNKQNLLSVIVSLALFACVPVVLAWTSPSATPPGGNVAAPVNVGLDYQIKQGKLGLFGGDVALRVSRDSSYTPDNVPLLPSLLLAANGKVGADKYCDEKGLNCIDLADINPGVTNNYSTTTVTTTVTTSCTQKTRTFPFYYAASNNKSYAKDITLPAGNWKITGEGMAAGAFYIYVSKNGKFDSTRKTLVKSGDTQRGRGFPTKYVGFINANFVGGAGFRWKIPVVAGTMTLTQPETLRIATSQGNISGTLIFEGPEDFVCDSSTL